MPAFYSWNIRVQVPNYAVAQGGVIDRETLQEAIQEIIPEAHSGDIRVMIIKAPSEDAIHKEQA